MTINIVTTGTSLSNAPWFSAFKTSNQIDAPQWTHFAQSGSAIGGTSVTHSITFSNGSTARKDRVNQAYVPGMLNLLLVEAGANDYYVASDTAGNLALLETLFQCCDDWRTLGYKVFLNTQTAQDDNFASGLQHNLSRAYIDPLVRAAVGVRIDACLDFAADPFIGPDAAALGADAADTEYYSDYVHLTGHGYYRMSMVARHTVESFISQSNHRFILEAGLTEQELLIYDV